MALVGCDARPCLRCSLLAGVPWGPSVLSCLSLGWWSGIPETAAPESVQTKVPSLTRGQVRPQLLHLPSTYTPLTRHSLQDGPPSSTRRRMTAAPCPSRWRARRMAGSRTPYFCGRVPRRHAHPDPPLNERALAGGGGDTVQAPSFSPRRPRHSPAYPASPQAKAPVYTRTDGLRRCGYVAGTVRVPADRGGPRGVDGFSTSHRSLCGFSKVLSGGAVFECIGERGACGVSPVGPASAAPL